MGSAPAGVREIWGVPQTSPLPCTTLTDSEMVARPAGEVEAAHSECGHLAEPDAGVGEEQDEPVGLILAFIELAMLARVRRAGARLGGASTWACVKNRCSALVRRGRLTPVATLRARRPSLTAMLKISESTPWTLRTVAGERV